jgi:hypothetical protein
MLSAAVAVTLSVRRRGRRSAVVAFGVITLVFGYTTIANVIERPDGVKIASSSSRRQPPGARSASPTSRTLVPWSRPSPVLFLEVTVPDPSEFESQLQVTGEERHGYRILRMDSFAVPNSIAAVLLDIRDRTGKRPHIYFDWTEGNPVAHLVRFLIFGSGEVAPVTREVLREQNLTSDSAPSST